MNVLVKLEDYIRFVEENKTPYLDRQNGYRLWHNSKDKILGRYHELNEVLEGIETDYQKMKSGENWLILFKTKSGNEYRLDLIKEPDHRIYHIDFTLFNRNDSEYELPTDLGESFEVFSSLSWILKDANLDVEEYCIGATGDRRKDSIYNYMMRFVKSWEKRSCDSYAFGWALYFKI